MQQEQGRRVIAMAGVNMQLMFRRVFLTHSTLLRRNTPLGWIYGSRSLSATTESASQQASKEEPEATGESRASEDQLQEIIESLNKEKESLSKKVADFQDKYQRTLADRENVRNRLEKQIIEAKQFGIQGFCKDLLEVSDVFHKAIESVPSEKIESGNSDLKTLYDGLVMTENQLLSVFRRHGLEKIVPKLGEKFDPSLQEAMFELPLPEQETGTVAHVIRFGWTLHSRCIRSAQVGVVKN
ncbi:hypothetical protein O3P69_013970 [Scylla paramamosain]|uniref:GrpE protein homolog n=1 Tax=Scylla paramamosain TaxID=85552 RepID=A0AAW0SR95_SCYPA